jgi:C1A family cysteine protease
MKKAMFAVVLLLWGELRGGHAICIVGYIHKEHSFICKNSWGTGWGEAGYFRIAFSEMDVPVRFGMYAARFEVSCAAPAMSETAISIWAGIKDKL